MISNKVSLLIVFLVILMLVFGYNKGGFDNNQYNLSIYLVKDLSTEEAMNMNIDELPLETIPILTDKEIEKYNWEEHIFYIKDGFSLEQKLKDKVPLGGKPFVFVIDGTRIYLGSFWNMISSYLPNIPTINSVWTGEFDNNKYHITNALEQPDPREDKRIYDTLKNLGKLD